MHSDGQGHMCSCMCRKEGLSSWPGTSKGIVQNANHHSSNKTVKEHCKLGFHGG